MKFLLIDGEILADSKLSAADKLIIAYIRYVESYQKAAWGSCSYIAKVLGIHEEFVTNSIAGLKSMGYIIQEREVLKLKVYSKKENIWMNQKAQESFAQEDAANAEASEEEKEHKIQMQIEAALCRGHMVEQHDGNRIFMRTEKGQSYVILKQ